MSDDGNGVSLPLASSPSAPCSSRKDHNTPSSALKSLHSLQCRSVLSSRTLQLCILIAMPVCCGWSWFRITLSILAIWIFTRTESKMLDDYRDMIEHKLDITHKSGPQQLESCYGPLLCPSTIERTSIDLTHKSGPEQLLRAAPGRFCAYLIHRNCRVRSPHVSQCLATSLSSQLSAYVRARSRAADIAHVRAKDEVPMERR